MKIRNALLSIAIILSVCAGLQAVQVKSPDSQFVFTFDVGGFGSAKGCAVYRVSYKGRTIIDKSRLGLEIKDHPAIGADLAIEGGSRRSVDTTWRPVYGELAEIGDHYNELTVSLRETAGMYRKVELTIRAYNEGVAFRLTVPAQASMPAYTITKERTEFALTGDYPCWAVYSAQGTYQKVPLSKVRNGCERPLVIEIPDGPLLAIGEAALVDYARMKLGPAGRENALVSDLSGDVAVNGALSTPWRFIMAAETPGRLLEHNYLPLNLNEPCKIADTSWIKPGKVIREVTLTTTGGKACVDFAAAHGLQYIEFDAGWYGPEGRGDSDATTVTVDPGRSRGPLDIHEVIAYAKSKGIGVIVYVNHIALEKQLDEILPLYRKWGIAGVKYGFVNVGSQKWTSWLHEAVRKAAENHLMVDIHDEYRPTGYSRTYPNLMTQEGIGGDETKPSNTKSLAILFTRFLCGPADNTICYYDQRVSENASHAYQLAKSVCFYSPWQFLYWYDRPQTAPAKAGGAGGGANRIGDEPELEFFDAVPTVWDDTKVIAGEIGQYAVIARKSGDQWFIGAMNANQSRILEIPLTFLDEGKTYTAKIYSDDPQMQTRTHVKITTRQVTCKTTLKANLTAKQGMAIRIMP